MRWLLGAVLVLGLLFGGRTWYVVATTKSDYPINFATPLEQRLMFEHDGTYEGRSPEGIVGLQLHSRHGVAAWYEQDGKNHVFVGGAGWFEMYEPLGAPKGECMQVHIPDRDDGPLSVRVRPIFHEDGGMRLFVAMTHAETGHRVDWTELKLVPPTN